MPAPKKPRSTVKSAPAPTRGRTGKVKPVDAEKAPPERIKSPYEALPVHGMPPPSFRSYTGRDELVATHPVHELTLDAGVFLWLWRMVEASALVHYNNPTVKDLVPEQIAVALRAVAAFREAAGTVQAKAADVSNGRKKAWAIRK